MNWKDYNSIFDNIDTSEMDKELNISFSWKCSGKKVRPNTYYYFLVKRDA